jgi:hypothetical protein
MSPGEKATVYDALDARCRDVAGIDLQEAVERACAIVAAAREDAADPADTMTFIFKCRRCGKISRGGTTSERHAFHSTVAGLAGLPLPATYAQWESWTFCECPGGGKGIADLIGYQPENQRTYQWDMNR